MRASGQLTLNLKLGAVYFFRCEETREMQVETPAANGATRGTEFVLHARPGGTRSFVMLDGELELSNAQGTIRVQGGDGAGGGTGLRAADRVVARDDRASRSSYRIREAKRISGIGVRRARVIAILIGRPEITMGRSFSIPTSASRTTCSAET